MELVKKILDGNEGSAARLISMIEDGTDEGFRAISQLFPYTGRAHIIGVTGAPGAGKSTLIGKLAVNYTKKGKKVGIIAVDPTSIKSSGALLGDRIRMRDAEKIGSVFIRSMANRGYPGGIAKATIGATYVLEGLGKDVIIIESVGAGQSEVHISSACDTVITLFTPDYGDDIQLMKAGIIEIGDIVALNKSDKPGAEDAAKDIEAHIPSKREKKWAIPVIMINALTGDGLNRLLESIESHSIFLRRDKEGEAQRIEKLKNLMFALLKEELWANLMDKWAKTKEFDAIIKQLKKREIDPYSAVSTAMKIMLKNQVITMD